MPFCLRDCRSTSAVTEHLKYKLLRAARADSIPEGVSGLWRVHRYTLPVECEVPRSDYFGNQKIITLQPGTYTQLYRMTMATMHKLGELVMQDTPEELNTHLGFMLRACGKVLITGLGLGCVVRGTLANPQVEHVTVIERDPHVLALVGPHMPDERLTIIKADAVKWVKRNKEHFDCAWHDLWSDPDTKEQHLQISHSALIRALASRVRFQGAWQFPRNFRRLWRRHNSVSVI